MHRATAAAAVRSSSYASLKKARCDQITRSDENRKIITRRHLGPRLYRLLAVETVAAHPVGADGADPRDLFNVGVGTAVDPSVALYSADLLIIPGVKHIHYSLLYYIYELASQTGSFVE